MCREVALALEASQVNSKQKLIIIVVVVVVRSMATPSASSSETEKQVMVIAIDDSEHSTYALKWTLDHFFIPVANPIFKLVLLHAKPSATSAVGLAGPGIIISYHIIFAPSALFFISLLFFKS